MATERFPFRYYGSRPLEAFEAAHDGHFFELCFARAPGKDALEAIAELFERRLLDGPASAAHAPWVWAGRWARFALGERFVSPDGFYARVEALLRAIHAIEPIEQVVNFNVRAFGEDDWERWSLAQQRVPTAGPAYDSFSKDAYRTERDSTLAPAPNADFEAARLRTRTADALSKANAAAEGALTTGKTALVPVQPDDVPPASEHPERARLRALFAENDWVRFGPSGRVVALIRQGGYYTSAAFVTDSGAVQKIELPSERWSHLTDINASADGRHALVAVVGGVSPNLVYRVRLEDGSAEAVFVVPSGIPGNSVSFCGDLAVVLTGDHLHLFDPSRFDREPLCSLRCDGSSMDVLCGGSLVVVNTYGGKQRVLVARVNGRKLDVVARFSTRAWAFEERAGRIFGRSPESMYELVNLPPPEEPKATKPPKAKKGGAPKIELQPTSEPSLPDDPSPDLSTLAGAELGAVSLSGRVVGCTKNVVSWLGPDGLQTVEVPFAVRLVAVSDDGTRVAVASDDRVVEIDVTTGATLQDVSTTWSEHGAVVSIAYTADGTLVALGGRKLLLLAGGAIAHSANVKGAEDARYGIGLLRPLGTNIVAVVALKGSERLVVFGAASRRLKALARFKETIRSIHSRGPRLFAVDSGDRWFEVVGGAGMA